MTGTTGTATEDLKKHLEAILGKYSVDSLQRKLYFEQTTTVRKVVQSETLSLCGGDSRWFNRISIRKNVL
jgi:hypothetical protein